MKLFRVTLATTIGAMLALICAAIYDSNWPSVACGSVSVTFLSLSLWASGRLS